MATKFPDLIEWIDNVGLDELHQMHIEYRHDTGSTEGFSKFVEDHYRCVKSYWETEMSTTKTLDVKFDDNGDVIMESIKQVLVTIINEGITNGRVREIILNEEMAPDYNLARVVLNEFNTTLIPTIQNFLNKMGVEK